jgi:hypothetical protein
MQVKTLYRADRERIPIHRDYALNFDSREPPDGKRIVQTRKVFLKSTSSLAREGQPERHCNWIEGTVDETASHIRQSSEPGT